MPGAQAAGLSDPARVAGPGTEARELPSPGRSERIIGLDSKARLPRPTACKVRHSGRGGPARAAQAGRSEAPPAPGRLNGRIGPGRRRRPGKPD
jgi:hypothetical protein